MSGYRVRQEYTEGTFVRSGQLLFQIDPRPFQAALEQAEGQLARSQGDLFQAQLDLARVRLQELLTVVQVYKALGGGWQ